MPSLFSFVSGLSVVAVVCGATLSLRGAGADLPTVPPDLRVEVFAREPMVRNPAAMAFDGRGRLFVGQGPQYRRPSPDTPPDSVVMLIDTDGDGVADTARTFATGFNNIQGLAWKGRDLWVGNAPDLTLVRDLDGDDEADEYIRIYADLGNIEHGVHGLHWGPDGKFYFSKGNSKGLSQPGRMAPKPIRELWDVETPPGTPDLTPPEIFRKGGYRGLYQDPEDDWGREGGLLRADDGGANLEIFSRGLRNAFDLAFDSGFNWLGTDNDQSYGDRIIMPFFGAHFGWGHRWSAHWTGEDHPPTVPVSGPLFDGSGTGVLHTDGALLPPAYRDVWLLNDWARRTTFLYRPKWEGALLTPEDGRWNEFIRGRDVLYQPVDLRVGPEGALYITGWGAALGAVWKDGEQANEGRVFRVSWPGAPEQPAWNTAKRAKPHREWTFAELAEDLGGALPVWRTDAQDELIRRGVAVRAELRALHGRGEHSRLAETWVLWTLGRIDPHDRASDAWFAERALSGGLNERLQALRTLAHRVRQHRPGDMLPEVVARTLRDPEPRLRHAAVLALHEAGQRKAVAPLADAAATETDRIVSYSLWRALRDLASKEQLAGLIDDSRGGVRRAALLALLDLDALTEDEVAARVADPDAQTAEVAALWRAKREGNPLIVIEPMPGAFTDEVRVKLTPGVKPGAVRYTFDGTEPTMRSRSHNTLNLTETTTLRAALFVEGRKVGPAVEATWTKRPPLSADDFATVVPPDRPTELEEVLELLPRARPERGRPVANALGCFACHRIDDHGGVFGPGLAGYGDRANPAHIIRSLLDPAEAITEGFALLSVTTRDGREHTGILREETDRILSLAQVDGSVLNLEKAAVTSRQSLHHSPMPSYAATVNPRQMADLVAWLLSQRTLTNTRDAGALADEERAISWELREDRLVIRAGSRPVADYVFKDAQTLRPHFRNLHAPSGFKVTRNHPQEEGDATDHATMHPGVWLAFGDINGEDFWRNKGRIVHSSFSEPPALRDGVLTFETEDRLVDREDRTIGVILSRFRLDREGDAYRLVWDATIEPRERTLVFGDQEEMGLGARLATPIAERNGGLVVNSDGGRGARAVWGKVADWCDYSAVLNGRRAGVAIIADPANPHRPWWHARDYGLLVANPFGKRALPPENESRLAIPPGEKLRLRFGVVLYDVPEHTPAFVAGQQDWLSALPR